jgi:hypothetical protein
VTPFRTVSSAALVAAFALAACGGDSEADPTTTVDSTTTSENSTTTSERSTTTSEEATTTTVAATPKMPLTGVPVTDEAVAARPALVVKIDDNPAAHPQAGLNQADVVYEEIVEVNTRFAAVFHTQDADLVGPIRSGRTQDVLLLGSFNRPLFAWSGGNRGVSDAIAGSDFVNLSAQIDDVYDAGGFFRERGRTGPHNLMASTVALWTLAPPFSGPPPQQFQYLADGQEAAGEPSSGLDVTMDSLQVGWTWDPASGTYLRTENGEPHVDVNDQQIATRNVLVIVSEYVPSPADPNSPEAQTIGTGEAMLFTGGKLVAGTWTRNDRAEVFTLTAADGSTMLLTAGNAWVELAEPDTTTPRPA